MLTTKSLKEKLFVLISVVFSNTFSDRKFKSDWLQWLNRKLESLKRS